MTAFQVAYTAKGYQCFRTVNGIYRLNVGPPFPDPKSAIRYAKSLEAVEAADVSPLRVSAEEPDLAVPPRRADGPGSSLEPRDWLRASSGVTLTPDLDSSAGVGLVVGVTPDVRRRASGPRGQARV